MAGDNLKSFKYSLRAVPVKPNGPFLRRIFLSVRGLRDQLMRDCRCVLGELFLVWIVDISPDNTGDQLHERD
jgi:hypothetical protein